VAKALSTLEERTYTVDDVLRGPTTKVSARKLFSISGMPPSTFKDLFQRGSNVAVRSEATVNNMLL
jgi:hypothetical protein